MWCSPVRGRCRAAGHCHCTRCQRNGGGGYVTGVIVPGDSVRIVAGQDRLGTYAEEGFTTRHFCTGCGSQVYGVHGDMTILTVGTLEPGTGIQPQFHMMVDFKARWDVIGDDLPQFGEYPPMGGD